MQEAAAKSGSAKTGRLRLRLVIGAVLLALMLAALALGASPQGLPELVQASHARWAGWVSSHLLLAAAGYALFYMLAVTISLPGALWFTIGAGFLLGSTAAIPASLFGITFGAANAWLIMRYLAGPDLRQRFADRIARFASGFRRDEFTYVVLLRVLPLPFFLVNLAAALLGHRFLAYFAGTLLGSLPSVVLYANLGAGLGELVEAGVQPGLSDLTRPSFLIAIAMVVLMVGVAVLHRVWTRRQARDRLPQTRR
ncbi:VTT domain-containing protein [uncultured Maricaulis sp.]|uniref:TVP38/TMEM64 family protein n=1 Tax=uncultured Maricaulis sp. TaxID=174710 RepID=UPI0030DAE496|tara:strand:+ start:278329 stop:279090 length:762 start_codon:yes stop_codon:yes gene_type:complete